MSPVHPAVSVIMTCYNREAFIAEAIESVLASDFNDFELIVADDASSDNTVDIAKEYASGDNRIRIFTNPRNLGDYPNRNHAVSLARGEFNMFCDSDDKFYPYTISYCVDSMKRFPDAALGMYFPHQKGEPFLIKKEDIHRIHFRGKPFLGVGPGGTIMKKSFFEKIGSYPVVYGPANDMYFNLMATCNTDMVMLPGEFLFYRIHEDQEQNNPFKYLWANFRYLKDALTELPLYLSEKEKTWVANKNRRRFFVNIMRYFFTTGNLSKTREAIRLAGYRAADLWHGIFHLG